MKLSAMLSLRLSEEDVAAWDALCAAYVAQEGPRPTDAALFRWILALATAAIKDKQN